jgi:hypothetical protein
VTGAVTGGPDEPRRVLTDTEIAEALRSFHPDLSVAALEGFASVLLEEIHCALACGLQVAVAYPPITTEHGFAYRTIDEWPGQATPGADGRRRPKASAHAREEMVGMLGAAARVDGSVTMKAAMYLLAATDLPGTPQFARHVDIEDDIVNERNGTGAWEWARYTCAWVRDWDRLRNDREAIWNEHQLALVDLAMSYATGRPVNLHDAIGYAARLHGPDAARQITQATAIAMGLEVSDSEIRYKQPGWPGQHAEGTADDAGTSPVHEPRRM